MKTANILSGGKTNTIMENEKIVCWWSGGGITSAVAVWLAISHYGKDNCVVVMQDTKNESDDTYRFLKDCEQWYGLKIKRISAIYDPKDKDCEWVNIGYKPKSIEDVWDKYQSLNVATGAICSTDLKRRVREIWQKTQVFKHQVFGFEWDKKEMNRALSLNKNHPKAKAIHPLLMMAYNKDDCADILNNAGIALPTSYKLGYRNNNCLKTKCVQGGIGYWQKVKREDIKAFNKMAKREHKYTDSKGQPVTMLKDQSNEAKNSGNILVFLKKHPDYPNLKCIDDMPDCKVEPLFECNGFCGVNDLSERSTTEKEINYSPELF